MSGAATTECLLESMVKRNGWVYEGLKSIKLTSLSSNSLGGVKIYRKRDKERIQETRVI